MMLINPDHIIRGTLGSITNENETRLLSSTAAQKMNNSSQILSLSRRCHLDQRGQPLTDP